MPAGPPPTMQHLAVILRDAFSALAISIDRSLSAQPADPFRQTGMLRRFFSHRKGAAKRSQQCKAFSRQPGPFLLRSGWYDG